jgi:hypothetical protein
MWVDLLATLGCCRTLTRDARRSPRALQGGQGAAERKGDSGDDGAQEVVDLHATSASSSCLRCRSAAQVDHGRKTGEGGVGDVNRLAEARPRALGDAALALPAPAPPTTATTLYSPRPTSPAL